MNPTILGSYIRQLCRFGIDLLSKEQIPFIVLLGLLAVLFDFAALSVFTDRGYPMEMTHLLSLFLGLHVSYMLFVPFCRKPTKYFHFLVVVLLCSFIRGGILSWFLSPNEARPPELPLLTIFATAGVTWLTAILICTRNASRTSIQYPAFPVFFILYTILLRLVYLGSPELIQEEAYYWNYSQHMATGYLDHPPVVALLIKIGTSLFGHNEFGVRIGAFACWFITAFFSYRLTKRVFNKEAGLRAVLLIATLPIFFFVGIVTTPDAPLIAAWSGAVYFLHLALVGSHSRSWYGAGLCLGIGLASKYTIAFLAPAIVLFMLLDANARKWFFRPQPYLAALLGLTIFSPVIWWNYQHDWASFLFQSQRRIADSGGFSTHELLGSILVLITPTGLIAAIAAMHPKFVRRIAPDFVSSCSKNSTYLFSFIMAAVPLSIFIFFSITKEIKLNWTGPLWLSLLPFMAVAMVQYRGTMQGKLNTIWPGTIVVSTLLFGCLLHYMSIGIPGMPFAQNDFLFGFDNLALQVRKELAENTHSTGAEPILVGADKYRIASGLAFYRRKNMLIDAVPSHIDDTTSRQLLGHDALMYNYWMPPAKSEDRDLLVISEKTSNLKPGSFAENDPRLGEIHSFTAMKHGKTAGTFYYRLISHHIQTGYESDTVSNVQQDSRDTSNRTASSLL